MIRLSWPARGLLLVLAATVIYITFFRDEVFVNINWYLWFLYDRDIQGDTTAEYHGDPAWYPFFQQFSYDTWKLAKWMLTFVFAAVNFALTAAVVHVLYRKRQYIRYTLFFYPAIIGVGGFCYATGFIIGAQNTMFEVARVFIHMAQGPLPIMLLVPAFLVMSSNLAMPKPKE